MRPVVKAPIGKSIKDVIDHLRASGQPEAVRAKHDESCSRQSHDCELRTTSASSVNSLIPAVDSAFDSASVAKRAYALLRLLRTKTGHCISRGRGCRGTERHRVSPLQQTFTLVHLQPHDWLPLAVAAEDSADV